MVNRKIIYKSLGSLLFLEATMMGYCLLMALCFDEEDVFAFLASMLVTTFFGFILRYMGSAASNSLSRRDAYLLVTVAWTAFSLFGSLPFLVSGYIPGFTDAFFESMSGFTTTGATVVDDIERFPHGLLFWRSLTQWLGGLGIVFFTVALVPSMSGGTVKVFAAEATGPIRTKLHPRLRTGARWIWMVYIAITVACMGCYMAFGMNWFEGICFAMSSAATGGFSIYNDSTAFFHSPAMEYTTAFFCFLSGINFTLLYYSAAKLRLRQLFRNSEFKLYFWMVAGCTAFIMLELMLRNHYDVERAFRSGVFQVVSLATTTGLFNDDAGQWPHVTWVVLAVCMFVGACSGSTGGGIKCVRAVMIFKVVRNEFRQILHPNAVLPLRVGGVNVSQGKRVTLLAFLAMYLWLCLVVAFVMIACGIDGTNAVTICLSCLSNVGPTLGTAIGPTMSWSELPAVAKWLCSAMMLVGRLEMFTVLVILTPQFWTKN